MGRSALAMLRAMSDVRTHLVLSAAARRTIAHELEERAEALAALADVVHDVDDIGAGPASGSVGESRCWGS